MPTTVTKSALKSRMLEYFRDVETTGEELVVTSHGRPVLKVIPYPRAETVERVFQDVRGRVQLPPDEELTAPVPSTAFADSDLNDLLT